MDDAFFCLAAPFIAAILRRLPLSLMLVAGVCLTPVHALSAGTLDLNHATAEALQTLKGVGPAMAARILAARAERPFESLEDLGARVRGAGPKRLQQWREAGLVVHPAGGSALVAGATSAGRVASVGGVASTVTRHVTPQGVEILAGQPVPVSGVPAAPVSARSRAQGERVAPGSRGSEPAGRAGVAGTWGETRAQKIRPPADMARGDRLPGLAEGTRHRPADVSRDAYRRPSAAAGCHAASRSRGRVGRIPGGARRLPGGAGRAGNKGHALHAERAGHSGHAAHSGHAGRAAHASRGGQVRSAQPSMLDTGPLFDCRSLFDAQPRLRQTAP